MPNLPRIVCTCRGTCVVYGRSVVRPWNYGWRANAAAIALLWREFERPRRILANEVRAGGLGCPLVQIVVIADERRVQMPPTIFFVGQCSASPAVVRVETSATGTTLVVHRSLQVEQGACWAREPRIASADRAAAGASERAVKVCGAPTPAMWHSRCLCYREER